MTEAPRTRVDPFGFAGECVDDRPSCYAELRQPGPVVQADAPAGGTVWIVTEDEVARRVLSDSRFAKDPGLAPPHWHGKEDVLEPPAAQRRSITTLDGEDHLKLRRVHAPAFTSRQLHGHSDRIAAVARGLLAEMAESSRETGEPADLTGGFTYHFPLTVLCDLLGVPIDDLGKARQASEAMIRGTQDTGFAGMAALEELVAAAVRAGREHGPDTLASVLHERAHDEFGDVTDDDMRYMIAGLIFAGHETTGSFLGFLLAHVLAGHLDPDADEAAIDAFVEEALRLHPPVPYTLWRFATTDVDIAGTRLPRGAPVLVAIEAINIDGRCHTRPDELRPTRADCDHLTFGDGPHYCVGARLARLEARIAVQVLRTDFPHAQLAAPFHELRRTGDTRVRRLAALPVWLNG